MRVVIFGGSGFVGQALAEAYLLAGYSVVSFSRRGRPETLRSPALAQVQWKKADVFNESQWQKLLQPDDLVVDAIGCLKGSPETHHRMHYEAASRIVTACQAQGVTHFVYIAAAHGVPFQPAYLKEKQRAIALIEAHLPVAVIVKPSLLYGEGRKGSEFLVFCSRLIGLHFWWKKWQPQAVENFAKQVVETSL